MCIFIVLFSLNSWLKLGKYFKVNASLFRWVEMPGKCILVLCSKQFPVSPLKNIPIAQPRLKHNISTSDIDVLDHNLIDLIYCSSSENHIVPREKNDNWDALL